MSIAKAMHADNSSERPPGCPFQTALGTLITIASTTITSAILRKIPILTGGFYVARQRNSSLFCVPAGATSTPFSGQEPVISAGLE